MLQRFKNPYILLALLAVATITRLLPNLVAPVKTFGYDFGFYLYNLNHSRFQGVKTLLVSAWGDYGNPLFPLINYFHIPSETFLLATQLFLTICVAFACYLFFSRNNKTAGLWAFVFCILSVAQTEVYLMFLWKSLLGMFFLLLAFKFLKEKRYILFILASLATALSHRSTTIILLVSLAIYLLYTLFKKQNYKVLVPILITAAGSCILLFPIIKNFWVTFTNNPNSGIYEGIFLANENYFLLSLPLLIFGLFGAFYYIKNKQHAILNIFAGVCLFWIIFALPFHNRFIPYFDIALILYAGYFIVYFKKTLVKKPILVTLLIIMVLQLGLFINRQMPLINLAEINEIKAFRASSPETLVLALDASDAPWLLGYLQGTRIAAPGLFENRDNYQEWLNFWQGREQKIFFSRYPRPLVLYQRLFQASPEVEICSPRISENFSNYECP